MRVRCGAICLIALIVASSDQESNQERGASEQLAAPLLYTHLLTDLGLPPCPHSGLAIPECGRSFINMPPASSRNLFIFSPLL